jgi:hypothetical protein
MWTEIIDKLNSKLSELKAQGCPDPYFRGHSNSDWELLPSLARLQNHPSFHNNKELRLFLNFKSMGAKLIPHGVNSWEILFLMQHHGLPTRLLDWSTNFSMALYFALKNYKTGIDTCIWILNPYVLNETIGQGRIVKHIEDATGRDYLNFIEILKDGSCPGAMAISPSLGIERILSQNGNFTLHGNLTVPLEQFCPEALEKFVIKQNLVEAARKHLVLAGVNEFSAFPDLDGLSRYITEIEDLTRA